MNLVRKSYALVFFLIILNYYIVFGLVIPVVDNVQRNVRDMEDVVADRIDQVGISKDYNDCDIEDEDAGSFPWMANLQISFNCSNNRTKDDYWPVVIIGPTTLLSDGRPFRARREIDKMRLYPADYIVTLTSMPKPDSPPNPNSASIGQFEVSYIRPFPRSANRTEYWMNSENNTVLIHLKTPIPFSQKVRKLCLWDPSAWSDGDDTTSKPQQPIFKPTDTHLITGWKCQYHYALVNDKLGLNFTIKNFRDCDQVWKTQGVKDVEYKNRICGLPSDVFENPVCNKTQKEFGLCSMKTYYHVVKTQGNKRVLVGTLNAVAQELFKGPTIYISLLTPNIVNWIYNASRPCPSQHYACAIDQKCIHLNFVCDQKKDCSDGSDEEECFCRARNYCESDEFECGAYGRCLPMNSKCNGSRDCTNNGEDEQDCPINDPGNWFEKNWTYILFPGIGIFFFISTLGGTIVRKITPIPKKDLQVLSDEEIYEFRQGCNHAPHEIFDEDDEEEAETSPGLNKLVQLSSMQMPYIYDIPKEKFHFGEEIGTGAYGNVSKGTVENTIVAIKVLKNELVDKGMFKIFLAELKIMAYVNFIKGGHENIIKLIGAYTENIRNLELFIAVEYCHFGSITDYLKNNRDQFQAYSKPPGLNDDDQEYIDYNSLLPPVRSHYVKAASLTQQFSIGVLHKWTQQIIEGMYFLASNKIVHGDLAARNLLLDVNLNVKISDFGLSRQIYYYNMSSQSGAKIDTQTKVPWCWMAPEVIENMKISTKSDVWSFGVTMWELYTLGAVPYGGLEWSPNFKEQLKCGLRLTKPEYASDEIYNVIKSCWEYERRSRPSFADLKDLFLELMNN